MHETFLESFEFEIGRNPTKSLIQVQNFKNTKLAQFWKSKAWQDWKFHKESKTNFCQIFYLQKGPQFPVFLSVFLEKRLV